MTTVASHMNVKPKTTGPAAPGRTAAGTAIPEQPGAPDADAPAGATAGAPPTRWKTPEDARPRTPGLAARERSALLVREAASPHAPDLNAAAARHSLLTEFAAGQRRRVYRPRQTVLHQFDRTEHVVIVLQGWAEQYVQLADGRRQIVGLAMPGDICSADLEARAALDCSIAALTPLTVGIVGKPEFRALLTSHPALARSIWNNQVQMLSIQRRWMTVLGQFDALERVAHLMCEIHVRQRQLGLADPGGCDFPLTQTQIADICGLTQVHTNRTIQELRRRKLIELRSRYLVVREFADLAQVGQFDPGYLDRGRDPRSLPGSGTLPLR